MKYFLDTDYIEVQKKKKFLNIPYGKASYSIDLISVALSAEDDRKYYAISKDFDIKYAWNKYETLEFNTIRSKDNGRSYEMLFIDLTDDVLTEASNKEKITGISYDIIYKEGKIKYYSIRDTILKNIWLELSDKEYNETAVYGDHMPMYNEKGFNYAEIKRLINKYGKTNYQISNEIRNFCSIGSIISNKGLNQKYYKTYSEDLQEYIVKEIKLNNDPTNYDPNPNFYVYSDMKIKNAFFTLFNQEVEVPSNFSKDFIYLESEFHRLQHNMYFLSQIKSWVYSEKLEHHPGYPKSNTKFDCLSRANWIKEVYEFLSKL